MDAVHLAGNIINKKHKTNFGICPGKRSRQTEGQWSPVWGPKPKKFQVPSSKFQNPFKIILKHLISKRGLEDVKKRSPLRFWMPKEYQQDEILSKRRSSGQNMLRIKLGAWSRVSK